MQARKPVRVLLAKVGLDGHDRGVKIVARALRDAGMEVVYTGLHRKPEEVVTAAVHGAHMTIFPRLIELLKQMDAFQDIVLIGGGVMPDEDVAKLKQMGVAEVLGQDTPPDEIVKMVQRVVEDRRGRR